MIIFEGIASSGKTTLERMLQEKLEGSVIISEGQTLMPLIENKEPQKAVEHLTAVLYGMEKQSAGTFIVDRFHLTHAFRTGAPLSFFSGIEERISKAFKSLIVVLQINEEVIRERIEETALLRGSSWQKGKQGSLEEKVEYYKNQQRILMDLTKQSHLPSIVINTTDKDWPRCIREVLSQVSRSGK